MTHSPSLVTVLVKHRDTAVYARTIKVIARLKQLGITVNTQTVRYTHTIYAFATLPEYAKKAQQYIYQHTPTIASKMADCRA